LVPAQDPRSGAPPSNEEVKQINSLVFGTVRGAKGRAEIGC
jgi:hypothetical protein